MTTVRRGVAPSRSAPTRPSPSGSCVWASGCSTAGPTILRPKARKSAFIGRSRQACSTVTRGRISPPARASFRIFGAATTAPGRMMPWTAPPRFRGIPPVLAVCRPPCRPSTIPRSIPSSKCGPRAASSSGRNLGPWAARLRDFFREQRLGQLDLRSPHLAKHHLRSISSSPSVT